MPRTDGSMARVTLRERVFPLHQPADVDALLARARWTAIFKAGTSDKTFEAWDMVSRLLEPRVDVALGFVRLPGDRPASEHVTGITGIAHRSPQLVFVADRTARFHLDEFDITPGELGALLAEHLPLEVGPPIRNEAVVSLEPYRALLRAFVAGELREELFQWAYLERLEKESSWRDQATFEALNALFENPWDRDVRPARLVSVEFKAGLAGQQEPLRARVARTLERLAMMEP
jgi:monothiol bacilliredoxin